MHEKIAILGPQGTFTEEAARRYFGNPPFIYCSSVTEVFDNVEEGKCSYGVVPIENSTEGSVSETIYCLQIYDTKVWGEVYHHIEHVLAGVGELKDVKMIYTHPQAIAQCRNKVKALLGEEPHIISKSPTMKVLSTARAMELVAEKNDPSKAVIGSKNGAAKYGLKVLAEKLSDQEDNETRFFILSKKDHEQTGKDKTSIIVAVKDESGALYELLGVFAKKEINLSKIESRPRRGKKWEYLFFIDLEGHKDDAVIKELIEEVKTKTTFFKLLGSYPRWV
jgi:chorismate mutase / prephenate dehydratase